MSAVYGMQQTLKGARAGQGTLKLDGTVVARHRTRSFSSARTWQRSSRSDQTTCITSGPRKVLARSVAS